MKKYLYLSFVVLLTFCCTNQVLVAQSATHEVGLRLTDLEDIGFIYKKQKAENRFTRFRVGSVNVNVQEDIFSLGLAAAIGFEKRKNIANKLSFIHGWEPSLFVSTTSVNDDVISSVTPGIGYVLGFQYDFSDNFYLSLESIPSLSASFQFGDNVPDNNYRINAGFNANAIALTAAYRFTTTKSDQ
ncbi:MAG: hypothetical protein AAGJ82_12975 [Bacteroidota bacterium]